MRAAVYVRVSTDKDEQKDSLIYQQEFFQNYIKDNGLELYKFYIDIKSGTTEKRVGLQEMIKDAQNNKFDIILTKELSRLARNQKFAMTLKELLENKKIDLITMDGAIDTTKGNTNMFGLYAWVYEQEAQTTSRQVKDTLSTRAKEGKHHAQAPYGYRKVEGKLIVADDETPGNVKRIFREYISGKGFDAIARGLYEEGYRTPSQVADKKNASELWHGSSVRGILENPHYLGKMVQGREETISVVNKKRKTIDADKYIVVENTHKPLISEEDFKTVQSLLKTRRQKAFSSKSGENQPSREISNRMKSELGISVSIGVSFNKIFAKLGSDYKKPDSITTMYQDEFKNKAWALPVSDLLYVGRSTNQKLARFGIKTIGDLARTDEHLLMSQLGKMGGILWAFANGYDDSPVKMEHTHAAIKSIGNSTTTPV